ncbi:uncharacterized protein KY384_001425 [Bacidia gigantensis]|uniref:uncharacterized protein n=1 Tax=Bacidia gigantensis TaxID=2732470 RepID=UPI001D03B95D|nr:uncharacterized protein KY384_001425 [Bacidia gigantensis]KAG8533684.1 hypothetical protein KY384_001425 [Bacidia gigantensis]
MKHRYDKSYDGLNDVETVLWGRNARNIEDDLVRASDAEDSDLVHPSDDSDPDDSLEHEDRYYRKKAKRGARRMRGRNEAELRSTPSIDFVDDGTSYEPGEGYSDDSADERTSFTDRRNASEKSTYEDVAYYQQGPAVTKSSKYKGPYDNSMPSSRGARYQPEDLRLIKSSRHHQARSKLVQPYHSSAVSNRRKHHQFEHEALVPASRESQYHKALPQRSPFLNIFESDRKITKDHDFHVLHSTSLVLKQSTAWKAKGNVRTKRLRRVDKQTKEGPTSKQAYPVLYNCLGGHMPHEVKEQAEAEAVLPERNR